MFFFHSSVDNLNAIPGFLVFFPGSSAYDFVRVRQCKSVRIWLQSLRRAVLVWSSEGGCGRYLRDRSSCKDLVCAVSHVNLERFEMRASGPHVVRRATVLLKIIGEIRVRLVCCQSVWWH